MELAFTVGDVPAVFHRDATSGRAELRVRGETVVLQHPARLGTQFSVRTTTTLRHTVDAHVIEIVRKRPLLLGGLRPSDYTITVDGQVVAAATAR